MQTAFTSWKLAKALYIIPIIMAYRPLLGMAGSYELLHWEVWLTIVVTTLGLISFAAALDRRLIREATWPETILLWLASAGLLWPEYWADAAGFVLFMVVLALQRFNTPAGMSETPAST
ncbi:MAG: hypothetical protein ACLFUE_07815, partial [Desulfobacteraceae bacterium]